MSKIVLARYKLREKQTVHEQLLSIEDDFGKELSIFRLAWKNVFSHGWMNAKMCFTFACLAFLLCLFTVYNAALNTYRSELVNGSISSNYIQLTASRYEQFKEAYPELQFVYEDSYLCHNYESDVRTLYGWGGVTHATTNYIAFDVDGTTYNATKSGVSLSTVGKGAGSLFYRYDYLELKEKFGLTSFMAAGREPEHPDEIAIGEHVLEAYGIPADGIIGRHLTAYLKDPREGKEPLLYQFEGTVCGVLRRELFELTGHTDTNKTRPSLLLSKENDFFQKNYSTRCRGYLAEWPEEPDALMWRTLYGATAYAGYSNVSGMRTLDGVQTLASNLYIIIGSSLVVGLILTIFLMIDKYIKVFSRSGGILMTLGLRRRHLYALLLEQLLILCAFAVPASLFLTAAGYFVINTVVSWATRIDLALSVWKIVGMLAVSVVIVFAVALLFFAYCILRLGHRSVKKFLTAEVD